MNRFEAYAEMQIAMRELADDFAAKNRESLRKFIEAGLSDEEAEKLLGEILAEAFRGLKGSP